MSKRTLRFVIDEPGGEVIYIHPPDTKNKRITKAQRQAQEFLDFNSIKEIDDEGRCMHKERDDTGICIKCGEWTAVVHQPSYNIFGSTYTQTYSIMKDIQNFPIEDIYKKRADEIYNDLVIGGVKVKSRKKMIAFSIYKAISEFGEAPNVVSIADMVGISTTLASRAIQFYNSPSNSSYKGIGNYTDPKILIDTFAKRIGCNDTSKQALKEDYEIVIQTFPELAQKPVISVILGLLHTYSKTNGIDIQQFDEFTLDYGRKFSTIEGISKRIFTIQNM